MNRQTFLQLSSAFAVHPTRVASIDKLQSIENDYPGLRLGVYVVKSRDRTALQHRADERFPLASTVKVPVVMAALHRVDLGKDHLNRVIRFRPKQLVRRYSVIAQRYPNGGALTLEQICRYTISQSDNTGVDLLFADLGGPIAVRQYVDEIGFSQFHIDRTEGALPGTATLSDPRDTTTPRAMVQLLQQLWKGSLLHQTTRKVLLDAMFATTTGDARLRAGVPKSWRVADKTGSLFNVANDVGFLFPERGEPTVIAVYTFGVAPEIAEPAIARVAGVASS